MPVQGKRGLAGVMLADDLAASATVSKTGSAKDTASIDFGAALGNLIAAMSPNQRETGTNASSQDPGNALPGVSSDKRSTGDAGAKAAAAGFPNQGWALQPSAFAPFTNFAAPAVDHGSALPDGNGAGASDSYARVEVTVGVPNSLTIPVEATVVPELGGSPLVTDAALSAFERLSIDRADISRKSAGTGSDQTGGNAANAVKLAETPVSISATVKVVGSAGTTVGRTIGEQPAPRLISVRSDKGDRASQSSDPGRQSQGLSATGTPPVQADTNAAALVVNATSESTVQKLEPVHAAADRGRSTDRGAAKVSPEAAAVTQSTVADEAPSAHAPAAAAVHQTEASAQPAQPAQPARIANLKVELGDGQSAQATVRERSGAVEVKIVAGTSHAAQRIGHEVEGLRNALDSAGLRLTSAEVSYQQPHGDRRQDQQNPYRDRPAQAASAKQVFTVSEVKE